MNQTTRWSVKCPACGAAPQQLCIGSGGKERRSVHIERWNRKLVATKKRAVKAKEAT